MALADSLAALPETLTQLDLWFGRLRSPIDSLTRNTAAGISMLTAIQSLQICSAGLDWSLLANLRNLKALEMNYVAVAEDGGNRQVLSRITTLTSLLLDSEEEPGITTKEAEALTSSSQLATSGPEAAGHVWSAAASGLCQCVPTLLLHLTELQSGAGILHRMASVPESCPSLQRVRLDFPFRREATKSATTELDMGRVAAGLHAMSGCRHLQDLELGASALHFPTPVWQVLGSFSSLAVWCTLSEGAEVCSDDVLYLTSCKSLCSLRINAR
jgi:hypothetical protein